MLSKEEIKKDIKVLKNISECFTFSMWTDDTKALRRVLNYIEQLESDNQKLIEKLEEELERNKRDTKLAETGKLNLSSEEWREIATEDKLIKEILSLLKGEKEWKTK